MRSSTGPAAAGSTATAGPTAVVRTTAGPVAGLRQSFGTVFRGVPYAAAPVGAGRFAAPSAPRPWTAVRDATGPGPTAPQPVRDLFGTLDLSPYFGPGWRRGRDYLTVDLWCPARDGERLPPAGAPVLVFVHGGGFVAGSTGAPLYDGAAFARDGVLLVTVNYRLGVPGFLHLPDAPDNRGLLDVLAALRWVRDNIAGFDGDPAEVTLMGQSAGGILVAGVLADPASRGLIRRAVVQSGSGTAAFTPAQADVVTGAVGRELALRPTARTLAEVGDERLVELMPRLTGLDLGVTGHHDPLGGITPFSLVLEQQPAAAVAAGAGHDVDLLIGSNLDEGSLYLAPPGLLATTTAADVRATAARFHARPDDVVAAYRARHPGASTAQLRTAILGDGLFGTGTRRLTAAHAAHDGVGVTFAYEFAWRSDALDGQLGASHVMELPFVFDRVDLPALHGPDALLGTAPPPADLVDRMHGAWVRFAASGDPGWPAHEPDRQHVHRFTGPAQVRPPGARTDTDGPAATERAGSGRR